VISTEGRNINDPKRKANLAPEEFLRKILRNRDRQIQATPQRNAKIEDTEHS